MIVGLDIGGSKTHALGIDGPVEGSGRTEAYAGSANLASVGEVEAGRQLDLVIDRLGIDPAAVRSVCAGAAGVDTPATADRMHRLLADRFPRAALRVVHDTELLLGAVALTAGVALIAGTGSVAWGRDGAGRTARAGGWGHQLGDEGSGYWIACQAVRHVLHRADRGLDPDPLTERLVAGCGLTRTDELLDRFYARAERRYWAGQAAVVFGLADVDPAAATIVERAADALAELVGTVSARLAGELPVVLGGGVLVHQPRLQQAVAARLPHTDVRPLTLDPVHGAVALARIPTHA